MKRLSFLALVILAPCALLIGFSPGILFDMTWPGVAGVVAAFGVALMLAPPWLTSFWTKDLGHDHIHQRAIGLGAGGRHGWPSSIVFVLVAVWLLVWIQLSRVGHALSMLATSSGHPLARNNMSAQPLPA